MPDLAVWRGHYLVIFSTKLPLQIVIIAEVLHQTRTRLEGVMEA